MGVVVGVIGVIGVIGVYEMSGKSGNSGNSDFIFLNHSDMYLTCFLSSSGIRGKKKNEPQTKKWTTKQ
jgi:hypothetical protein